MATATAKYLQEALIDSSAFDPSIEPSRHDVFEQKIALGVFLTVLRSNPELWHTLAQQVQFMGEHDQRREPRETFQQQPNGRVSEVIR